MRWRSDGVYWKPVWHLLEPVCALILANPAHIRNVPGRETDVKDAEWIGELLSHGLIEASFVPPEPIQELRALTRDRRQFRREAAQHVQRIQKVLQDANIKIDSVISDVKSGRAFLNAIIDGERDPEMLASHADPHLKASRKQIEALRGVATPLHRTTLRRHLQTFDHVEAMVAEIDAEVATLLKPFRRQIELLDAIPGVDIGTAQVRPSSRARGLRRGRRTATCARSSWYMLTRNEEYKEIGDGVQDEKQKERAAKRLVGRLKKLGYDVELPAEA